MKIHRFIPIVLSCVSIASVAADANPVVPTPKTASSKPDAAKVETKVEAQAAAKPTDSKAAPPTANKAAPAPTAAVASSATATVAASEPSPVSNPAVIYQKNVFDPQRKPWTLPVDPPPPPPPPPPLTENDVKVLGAWTTNGVSKALVGLSPKMLPPPVPGKSNRPFRTIQVGDTVGNYQLVEISLKELVFETNGARTSLPFKVTQGRAAAGISIAPPDQVALSVAAPSPVMLGANGEVTSVAATQQAATPEVSMNIAPPPPAPIDTGTPAPAAPGTGTGGSNDGPKQGMSLLEAIEYARKNPQTPGSGGSTNPFAPQPNTPTAPTK